MSRRWRWTVAATVPPLPWMAVVAERPAAKHTTVLVPTTAAEFAPAAAVGAARCAVGLTNSPPSPTAKLPGDRMTWDNVEPPQPTAGEAWIPSETLRECMASGGGWWKGEWVPVRLGQSPGTQIVRKKGKSKKVATEWAPPEALWRPSSAACMPKEGAEWGGALLHCLRNRTVVFAGNSNSRAL
eukprot:gene1901-1270_t